MKNLYRLVDANINRASEGLRVIEDIIRFCHNNSPFTEKLRYLRHQVRNESLFLGVNLIRARNTAEDVGFSLSQQVKDDKRFSRQDVINAGFKRVQEAVRTIEEGLKALGYYESAKKYEQIRMLVYEAEQQILSWYMKQKKLECISGIYGITASQFSCGRNNIDVVKAMVDAGIKVIQYREKDFSLKKKYQECALIREITKKSGVMFIVNDHVDLALMVGADGVHIGQDDWPIEKVRSLIGQDMIIGISTHSPQQAQAAVRDGADYIGVGPIYRTFTKKDVCEPVGIEYLKYAIQNVTIPLVAIGGIKEFNIHEVAAYGAECICLVTEIVGATNIGQKIKRLNEIMKKTMSEVEKI